MSFSLFALPSLLLLAVAVDENRSDRFDDIADAVAAADTCEQIGYSVDRDGLIAWSEDAKRAAIADGMSSDDAFQSMQQAVLAEFQRWNQRWIEARRMSHSIENVSRYNSQVEKRCERLTSSDTTGPYFSKTIG